MKPKIVFSLVLFSMSVFINMAFSEDSTNLYQYVSPRPGSENNTRESTIIIRPGEKINPVGLLSSRLIQVTGSESGNISGSIVLSDDGKTIIFRPDQKFRPAETVTVHINKGLRALDGKFVPSCEFSFQITSFSEQPNPYDYLPELREAFPTPIVSSISEPGRMLQQGDFPAMTVNVCDSSLVGEGYIFMAVAAEVPGIGYYLMILNNDGTPFFARELPNDYAYDFKVQPNGFLSYAQFLVHHSYTGGGDVIHMVMDNSFTVIDSFQMGNGYIAEGHDFQILPNGHVLLFGYYLTQVDMSQIVSGGYPNALVSGGVVQELDNEKNVVFQWRSWDYYDFETYPFTPRTARSPIVSEFHLNTINLDTDGQIIIATPTWVKKINRQTGDIIWHLSDFDNDFSFIGVDSLTGLGYVGGHMFHRIPNGHFLLYDNGNRPGTRSSQVHEFILDEQNKTAELVWSYMPDSTIAGWHRGNAQRLSNGNTVIGWGGSNGDHIPACTEVTADGQKVFEISFDNSAVESYRAFRFPFPNGESAADVSVFEISPGNTYNFMQGDTNDTGVSVRINALTGSGYNEMRVKKYLYAPLRPEFPGKPPLLNPTRMVLSTNNITTIDADVMFDAPKWQIQYPDSSVVYRREFEGSGLFVPLATTYNPVTKKIIANTDRTGEFILAWPDLASIIFTPRPYAPEDSGTVNQDLPVTLRWNPVGFVNEYSLQVAGDENFQNILISQDNMTDAFFTLDSVAADTTYYWRVKAFNDAGGSDWSLPQMFTTIPSFVSVMVPNGGEQWQRGLEYFIQWRDNIEDEVVLELYRNQNLVSVIDTVESTGAFNWEIPFNLETGNDYFVSVKSISNQNLSDASDNAFNIMDTTGSIITNDDIVVKDFELHQNFPNPFNPQTFIEFDLPKSSRVILRVYDLRGSLVDIPVEQYLSPGRYKIPFSGERLASGIYFYTLQAGNFVKTRKMILIQ